MEFLDEESKINFAWLLIMEKFQCDTKVALLYFRTFTKSESKATLPKTGSSLPFKVRSVVGSEWLSPVIKGGHLTEP